MNQTTLSIATDFIPEPEHVACYINDLVESMDYHVFYQTGRPRKYDVSPGIDKAGLICISLWSKFLSVDWTNCARKLICTVVDPRTNPVIPGSCSLYCFQTRKGSYSLTHQFHLVMLKTLTKTNGQSQTLWRKSKGFVLSMWTLNGSSLRPYNAKNFQTKLKEKYAADTKLILNQFLATWRRICASQDLRLEATFLSKVSRR